MDQKWSTNDMTGQAKYDPRVSNVKIRKYLPWTIGVNFVEFLGKSM